MVYTAKLKLVIIDDDMLDRERVQRMLKSINAEHECFALASIEELKSNQDLESIDCVLLDFLLPEGTALEFIPQLRTRMSQAAIVVLTGHGDETVAVELMKIGASDYLRKDSLTAVRLQSCIINAVRLRRLECKTQQQSTLRQLHAELLQKVLEVSPRIALAKNFKDLANNLTDCASEVIVSDIAIFLETQGEDYFSNSHMQSEDIESKSKEKLRNCLKNSDENCSWTMNEQTWLGIVIKCQESGLSGVIGFCVNQDPELAAMHLNITSQFALLAGSACDNISLHRAAEDAMRARDDIMAVVSHDLRAPLNNIKLGAHVLRLDSKKDAEKIIDRIDRSVNHMARLVDDLIDMVQIKTRTLSVNTQCIKVEEIVDFAKSIAIPLVKESNIDFNISNECKNLCLMADKHRIIQVLNNVLGNAIKFTPTFGNINLEIKKINNDIRFTVSDTGCGIEVDPEFRTSI